MRKKKSEPNAANYKMTLQERTASEKFLARSAANPAPRLKVLNEKQGKSISFDHPDKLAGQMLWARTIQQWKRSVTHSKLQESSLRTATSPASGCVKMVAKHHRADCRHGVVAELPLAACSWRWLPTSGHGAERRAVLLIGTSGNLPMLRKSALPLSAYLRHSADPR
jgi:hypothetical protein